MRVLVLISQEHEIKAKYNSFLTRRAATAVPGGLPAVAKRVSKREEKRASEALILTFISLKFCRRRYSIDFTDFTDVTLGQCGNALRMMLWDPGKMWSHGPNTCRVRINCNYKYEGAHCLLIITSLYVTMHFNPFNLIHSKRIHKRRNSYHTYPVHCINMRHYTYHC